MHINLVTPPRPRRASSVAKLLEQALDEPISAPRLEDAVRPGANVVIVVSDSTRDDPRAQMVDALLRRMPDDIDLTIAVANGTHGPCDVNALGLAPELLERAYVVNHDANDAKSMVTIGRTTRGTPVRIHRCVVTADWIIATGRIKPHYFAGFGAGCKAIFPGLGENRGIRVNHELKSRPGARPGIVAGNPCRDDLEEAAAMVRARQFLLNLVFDAYGGPQYAVAGDVRQAFLVGAHACAPFYRARAPRSNLVVVSDSLPVTGSLYQASKLVAAAASLLIPGGTMAIVAECPDGIGPVSTVNRAIYEIGLAPRLPKEHTIVLVSGLDRSQVEPSYCDWAPSMEAVLARIGKGSRDATVLPRAGAMIIDVVW